MTDAPPRRPWRTRFENGVIRGDDLFDAAVRRVFKRRPHHIAAYRSFSDAQGVELMGRMNLRARGAM